MTFQELDVPSRPPHPAALPYLEGHRPGPARKSRWWLWLIPLIVLAAGAYFVVVRLVHPQTTGPTGAAALAGRPVPVVASPTVKGNMNIYLTGLGTVTAFNTVVVRSRVDGQIIKVYFTEGQTVKKDDPLVEVDPRPFQAQLKQAQGQLARDQALLENANRDLDRYQSIRTSVTQQQIDTQAALVKQYQGAVEFDQGQIDNANLQITYSHITAPIGGRIGLRLVDEGNIVHAADSNGVAVITQLQPIAVLFTISEDDISRVMQRPDHGDGLEVDAYDREIKTEIASGSLLAIDNQVDATTGMVRLKGVFANEDDALFPNQFVNARLLVDTLRRVVIAPSAAVQLGPDGRTFVYVVKSAADPATGAKHDQVELRDVTVGPSEADQTIIEKGVAPGEVVVIEGVDKLQDGYKVTVHLQPVEGKAPTTRPASTTRPAGPTTQPGSFLDVPGGRTGRRDRK